MATKGEIVSEALDVCGFSGSYESTLTQKSLKALERMMTAWTNEGLELGYNKSPAFTPSASEESGLDSTSLQAVVCNLAIKLCATFLRLPVTPELSLMASNSKGDLYSIYPPQMARNPYMPLGQGESPCYGGSDAYYYNFQQPQDVANYSAKSTIDTETVTPIAVTTLFYDVAGSTAAELSDQFDQPERGQLRYIGDTPRRFTLDIDYLFSGTVGNQVSLKVRKWDDALSGHTSLDVVIADIESIAGVGDRSQHNLYTTIQLSKNDYISLQVANGSSTDNVTALQGSTMVIKSA